MKIGGFNVEELFIGYIYGLISCFAIGWYGLLIAPITSFLWALTGSEYKQNSKLWRRLVNPVILSLMFVIGHKSLIPLASIPLQYGSISLGYGTPSTQPPDEGSFIGRIFGDYARVVWFGLLGVAMIPLWF